MKSIDLYNTLRNKKLYKKGIVIPKLQKANVSDVANCIKVLLDDRQNKIDNQTNDNNNLINKIEILNKDVRKLISENNKLNNDINNKDTKLALLNAKSKDSNLTIKSLIIVLLLSFIAFSVLFVKGNKDYKSNKYNIEHIKDSLKVQYQDTIFMCNDIITKQTSDLIGAQNRFNFAIDYYNATPKEQKEMELQLNEIIQYEAKRFK